MASSPEHLQPLIHALAVYCATLHMEINVAKTKVTTGGLQAFCQIAFFCGQCFHMQWPASGAC